ncbi:DUF3817 domain-containing protein [bacterium]|nr:MAG: DUF3817 domain-containing protein [bacterium]
MYTYTRKKGSLQATHLERVRSIGIAEGVSFLLLLLVAMPLKYAAGEPAGVKAMGAVHGGMFVVYILTVLLAFRPLRWGFVRLLVMLAAGFIPLGTFFIEPRLRREEAQA